MRLDQGGGTTFPLLVIFGVLLAFMMTFVFISVYDQQLNARVATEAESLAEGLAQTAFQSLSSGTLTTYDLPSNLGGSEYTVKITDNSTFVVTITSGRKAGSSYGAVVNARILIENSNFEPRGKVYFMQQGGQLVVSSSEISLTAENVFITPTATPPDFYHFAKENAREAAGIAAAFFEHRAANPAENSDVTSYAWAGDNLLVEVTVNGDSSIGYRVGFVENSVYVGSITSSWVVVQVENTDNLTSGENSPSIENAYSTGWYHSSGAVINHLRSRTWNLTSDNSILSVPAYATIAASSSTTNVATYPTWRVTFDNQTMVYRGMPWWEAENTAGFIFQAEPELFPVV